MASTAGAGRPVTVQPLGLPEIEPAVARTYVPTGKGPAGRMFSVPPEPSVSLPVTASMVFWPERPPMVSSRMLPLLRVTEAAVSVPVPMLARPGESTPEELTVTIPDAADAAEQGSVVDRDAADG